ncbi:hypothetical protein D3C81_545140 [compost metagenome]
MKLQTLWQLGKGSLLWTGIALCGYALWRSGTTPRATTDQLSPSSWIAIASLLATIWILAVSSWRFYLRAYRLGDTRWRTACRHLGLLLIGKYIPGGIFGFLMRIYDQPKAQRQKLFWASLADQCTGIAMPAILGICLLLIGEQHNWLWAIPLLLLPLAAVIGTSLLHRLTQHLPRLLRHADPMTTPSARTLHLAATIQLGQIGIWAALTMHLAQQLYGLDVYAACGVAGAYLLAVTAGMLVIFLPSGIGAREAALLALTTPWLDLPQAIHLAALLRVLSSLLDVFAGICSTVIDSKENKNEAT